MGRGDGVEGESGEESVETGEGCRCGSEVWSVRVWRVRVES